MMQSNETFGTFRARRRTFLLLSFAAACLSVSIVLFAFWTGEAYACRDYDGHRNWVVVPSCGYSSAGYSQGYGGTSSSAVDAAIDAAGLPYVFHSIAQRESGDDPTAVNPYSGACGWSQFLPSTAAYYGYTCADLMDPYVAAYATKELYEDYGLSPWSLTAY